MRWKENTWFNRQWQFLFEITCQKRRWFHLYQVSFLHLFNSSCRHKYKYISEVKQSCYFNRVKKKNLTSNKLLNWSAKCMWIRTFVYYILSHEGLKVLKEFDFKRLFGHIFVLDYFCSSLMLNSQTREWFESEKCEFCLKWIEANVTYESEKWTGNKEITLTLKKTV